jgi:redox-sensitive bicupin YhaK (pirin superfamily)
MRAITKQFLPEGFPAHPHRGFTTLTYILEGGFTHRDSLGIRQAYGSAGMISNPNIVTPVQWLFTGAGLLHEEMFDTTTPRQELYQLWINVPAQYKLSPPQVQLLSTTRNGNTDETTLVDMPVVKSQHTSTDRYDDRQQFVTTKSTTRVLAGTYRPFDHGKGSNNNKIVFSSTAPTMSDMNILQVTLSTIRNRRKERKASAAEEQQALASFSPHPPGWTYEIPPNYDTLLLYIRKGSSCTITTTTKAMDKQGNIITEQTTKQASIHTTVFIEPSILQKKARLIQETLTITPNKLGEEMDVLVLAGQPLYEQYANPMTNTIQTSTSSIEPVSMQGSMVMNYPHEIQQAYLDYQRGKMGLPWDHELSDEKWQQHVQKYSCQYRYSIDKLDQKARMTK